MFGNHKKKLMAQSSNIEPADGCVVAHISDVKSGTFYRTDFVVGTDIPKGIYEKFRDASGHIHIDIFYENGEPVEKVVTKEMWWAVREQLGQLEEVDSQEGPGRSIFDDLG